MGFDDTARGGGADYSGIAGARLFRGYSD